MQVLAQHPEGIAMIEQISKQFARLIAATDRGKGVDVPELAGEERGFGQAEIVFGGIAHHQSVAHQFPSDGVARFYEARIVGGHETKLSEQQDACIELARDRRHQ